jgi:hypothetical protein
VKTLWTISDCPACKGSGYDFRCECVAPCEHFGAADHDRLCPRCDGNGEVPERLTGWEAFAASFVSITAYPTRRQAAAIIAASH